MNYVNRMRNMWSKERNMLITGFAFFYSDRTHAADMCLKPDSETET
jgi:hypothetical protein